MFMLPGLPQRCLARFMVRRVAGSDGEDNSHFHNITRLMEQHVNN